LPSLITVNGFLVMAHGRVKTEQMIKLLQFRQREGRLARQPPGDARLVESQILRDVFLVYSQDRHTFMDEW
jgi:hypothetical protein